MIPPAGQDSSLAALIGAAAAGKRLTAPERDALRHELIPMKKNGNVSWSVIGSVYGLSGREMKRVKKALMTAKPGQS